MKKILIHVRNEDYKDMEPVLEDIHHIILNRDGIYQIEAFVPDAEINEVIEKIREPLDLRYKENLIEVSSPDFVISTTLSKAEKVAETHEKTPVEELLAETRHYAKLDGWSLALTSIAGLIALTGLFMNNVAIIIGAMLLSPILGPIHSFAINAAAGNSREAVKSISVLGELLISVFVVSSVATFLMAGVTHLLNEPALMLQATSEIISRTESSPIYIIMAVLLGFASILALYRSTTEVLAGVAIAAALLPPTVVTGIMLVMDISRATGSFVLVIDNIVGLVAGAMFATLVLGIAPRGDKKKVAKQFIWRALIILVVLTLILIASWLYL